MAATLKYSIAQWAASRAARGGGVGDGDWGTFPQAPGFGGGKNTMSIKSPSLSRYLGGGGGGGA